MTVMTDGNGDVPTLGEPSEMDVLVGKAAGMLDAKVDSFDWYNFTVERTGKVAVVRSQHTGEQLGGKMYLPGTSLNQFKEWLEAKHRAYNAR